jgi:mannose-6-phosphate isomerase-like protein (cupin superfamily)
MNQLMGKKIWTICRADKLFRIIDNTERVQAAVMTLKSGQNSGPYTNEHPNAEQWLYVIAGRGRAIVNGRKFVLKERTLLLIPRRARHQITNTSKKQMITLNFYSPPAYTSSGNVRATVK